MGNIFTLSASAQEELRRDKESFKKRLATPPDLKVNKTLQMFTSLSCSDSLTLHFDRKRQEAGDSGLETFKALVDKLAGLSPAPEVAGLGALAFAVLIDTLADTPPAESTKEALHAVLASQKVTEVWDLVDETLKRCAMHMENRKPLKSNIQRLEGDLSAALTRLKNSVLRDGHISSEALKVWVNAAAFHVQMLIHQERLEQAGNIKHIEELLNIYKSNLEKLFRKHEEMIKSQCTSQLISLGPGSYVNYLVDEESRLNSYCYFGHYHEYLQLYYQHQYGRQEEEIQSYFTDIQRKLKLLVAQEGRLSLT